MSARRMLSSSAWARDQRLAAIGLGVALLLNLALALPRLGDAPFNFNESATAVVLDGPFSSLLERVRDTHPTGPVYFYLLFPWAAEAGLEPGPLRAFSLLFGVATVAMLFVFGASLRLPGLGAVAALLAAAWPYLIWLEHLVRWYTLATFLSVASALLFVRVVERSATSRALAYGATAGLAGSIFTPAFVLPGAHVAAGLMMPGAARRCGRAFGIALLAVAAIGLLELPLLLAQREIVSDFWIPSQGWEASAKLLRFYGTTEATVVLLLCSLAGGALGLLRPRVPAERLATLLCVAWALALPVVLVARTLLGEPSIVTRYATPSLPALILLAAGLLSRLPGALCLAALAAALVPSLLWLRAEHVNIEGRAEVARTFEQIHDRVGEGEALVYTDRYMFLPAKYLHGGRLPSYLYEPGLPPRARAIVGSEFVLEDPRALSSYERIWVVTRPQADPPPFVPERARRHVVPPFGYVVNVYRPGVADPG